MILNMDKIQFESRAEIGTIIKALEDWQEDHGKCDRPTGSLPPQRAVGYLFYSSRSSPRSQSFSTALCGFLCHFSRN